MCPEKWQRLLLLRAFDLAVVLLQAVSWKVFPPQELATGDLMVFVRVVVPIDQTFHHHGVHPDGRGCQHRDPTEPHLFVAVLVGAVLLAEPVVLFLELRLAALLAFLPNGAIVFPRPVLLGYLRRVLFAVLQVGVCARQQVSLVCQRLVFAVAVYRRKHACLVRIVVFRDSRHLDCYANFRALVSLCR